MQRNSRTGDIYRVARLVPVHFIWGKSRLQGISKRGGYLLANTMSHGARVYALRVGKADARSRWGYKI